MLSTPLLSLAVILENLNPASFCFAVPVGHVWNGSAEEQQTRLSKQQIAQLIRSIILVEQVGPAWAEESFILI